MYSNLTEIFKAFKRYEMLHEQLMAWPCQLGE